MNVGLILSTACAVTLGVGSLAAQSRTALDSAFHALNRLAYGPRPGDVEAVARGGVMAWIESQLRPERLADDSLREIEHRFTLLAPPRAELARQYVELQQARARLARSGMSEQDARRALQARMASEPGGARRRPGPVLQQLHLTRAVYSQRQLYEVLVDFWVNHFNVHQGKGLDRILMPAYLEETIRPHALGSFEELLIATAQSPAMLFYLDNHQSVAPGTTPPNLERAARSRRMTDEQRERIMARVPRGINENYARELLELHTLGVDGGYSQQDVQEVARMLTGWSIARPRDGAGFRFNEWAHDRGEKVVLGRTFPAGGGMDEGVALLRFLAQHPATRRHVSHKLCERLVADDAPDGCVDAAVRAWERTGGDIREVVRAIVRSPEFWSPAARAAKTKTPLEFVVSAVRAVGGRPDSTPRLAGLVARLGQPIFLQPLPTGYPETQEDWVNSGALLSRMNVAMQLAAGRAAGVAVDLDAHFAADLGAEALIARIDSVIFAGTLSARTREVIAEQVAGLSNPVEVRALAIGLALGGPGFQRQ